MLCVPMELEIILSRKLVRLDHEEDVGCVCDTNGEKHTY